MVSTQHPETHTLSPGGKAGAQSDEAGAVGAPGQARSPVSAEASTKLDYSHSPEPGAAVRGRAKLNAEQLTLLLIALLLAVAIVIAAVIVSKNL